MFLKSKKIEGFAEHEILISGKKVLIRQADLEDSKKLVAIEEAVYTGSAPWNQLAFVTEIAYSRHTLYLSASVKGQAIAFIGLTYRRSSKDLHITNIAVLPIWQHQGLGSYLLNYAGRLARLNKVGQVTLEVRRSNRAARQLYEKIGFKKKAEVVGYYDDDHEDAIEMAWQL